MNVLQHAGDVINDFSLVVKVGWAIWFAWAIAQLVWYRRVNASPKLNVPAWRANGAVRAAAPRPAVEKKPATAARPSPQAYGTSDFLATLDAEMSAKDAASSYR